jgi:hypothetical protein
MVKEQDIKTELPYRVPTEIGVWGWWIILAVFSVLFIIGLISVIDLEGFKSGLWCFGIILALGFGLLKLHPVLLITSRGVCYREFLFFQNVDWPAIQEIKTTAVWHRGTELKGGVCEMDIYHTGTGAPNPIAINVKIFTRNGLIELAELLAKNATHAKLDEGTENLIKGIMPSLF